MSLYGRLNRGETEIDFVGNRKRWFTISAVLLVIALGSLGVRQLNLGIEFVGGLGMQAPNPAGADVSEIRDALEAVGVEDATIQLLDDGDAVRVATPVLDQASENEAAAAFASVTGSDRADISIEAVGPSFGALVARRALIALGVFLGAVVLFISWRLEFKMAAAGLVALFHDLLITLGVYALTGFPVTPATVVAILVILGYSLYDTVVVFDKVEELVEIEEKKSYSEIVNEAMNSVLARSLVTSLTSLLPVGSILFVGSFILGASTLRDFALALFVGIAAGTYSSIFVAAPLLAIWKEREPDWQQRAKKSSSRSRAGMR
ncbi:MAG: protein translocase subunit SecF [Actinobacteria bacterium]|nr:protein translocase subunit SecF [Actinomycetota bacterium]MCZ6567805.1 protein translocase subunit SecF [Actinomycetota bacterium]